MPDIQKLQLEDSLDDTPQTRSMLDLFEKDAQMLRKFCKAFSSSCQKVSNAQVMMISATQELSYYLRLYGEQNFPLDPATNSPPAPPGETTTDKPNEFANLSSTLNQFANYIDEISTCFQVFVTQLNDAMIYPLNKQVDNEFDELNSLSQMYQISSEEQDQAMQKYLRIPFKREYDVQRKQVGEEVSNSKRKFHQTSMSYFSFLNSLQYKRKYMLIEPMLSFMHSLKLFFKMGSETYNSNASSTIDDYLNKTSTNICEIKASLSDEMNKSAQLMELLQQDESIYLPEPPFDNNLSPINEITQVQKSGYLNLRSRFPLLFKWERAFYFIQNGCLMHQQKNEVAGYVFMELKSDLTVSKCEVDDRQFTFQIISQFPKRITYFQANSNRDCEEWVRILENAINDDNRSKLQNHMNSINLKGASNIPVVAATSATKAKEPLNVRFELNEQIKKDQPNKILKPQLGDLFKVRFLGSMNVKADKGNEYINETIRQVMAARAEHNIFKLSEFNMVINSESIGLFKIPPNASKLVESMDKSQDISPLSSDDLLKARINLGDLAFWSPHRENERLFGFIIKETSPSLKFLCHVFESDVNSTKICESITNATQVAFQLLVKTNQSILKKMKQAERDILLQNIRSLPDKPDLDSQSEFEDDGKELLNAAVNSPNPNFVVFDKETLENFKLTLETNSTTSQEDDKSSTKNETENGVKNSESEA